MQEEIKTWDHSPTDSRYHSPGLLSPCALYDEYKSYMESDEERRPYLATKNYFVSIVKANFDGIIKWTSDTGIGKCQRCVCFREYVLS